MSSSHSAPDPQRHSAESTPAKTSGPRDTGALSAEFLGRVLAETEAATADADVLTADERHSLIQVAQKYAGRPLTLDPVAIELVQSMLSAQFTAGGGDSSRWRRVAENIARSLMDDPVAKEKMTSLWARLAEMAP